MDYWNKAKKKHLISNENTSANRRIKLSTKMLQHVVFW